jgi:hypothetical protein
MNIIDEPSVDASCHAPKNSNRHGSFFPFITLTVILNIPFGRIRFDLSRILREQRSLLAFSAAAIAEQAKGTDQGKGGKPKSPIDPRRHIHWEVNDEYVRHLII